MSWLEQFQADRAVSAILKAPRLEARKLHRAIEKLQQIGPPAVPPLVAALARGIHADVIEKLLASLVSNEAIPAFCEALCHRDPEVVRRVAKVLARPGRFDPNQLVDLFRDPDCSKPLLAQLLSTHAKTLRAAALVHLLDQVSADAKAPLLDLLYQTASPTLLPELARRLDDEDPVVRAGIARILGRFPDPEVQGNLVRLLLGDGHKPVRLAALEALSVQKLPPLGPLFQLLHDPDMVIQGKALQVLVGLDHPDVARRAVELMADEAESVRRAAVEILNRRPEAESLEPLVQALRDHDWWTRERAADALADLDSDRAVELLLPLLAEADPEMSDVLLRLLRRFDPATTFDRLIFHLKHGDEPTRRGAVRALGDCGDRRAVFPLLGMLPVPALTETVVEALRSLGEPEAVPGLVNHLESGESSATVLMVDAAVALVDRGQARELARTLRRLADQAPEDGQRDRLTAALEELETRFEHVREEPAPVAPAEPPSSVTPVTIRSAAPLNPLGLATNDVVGDRYRVIRMVGRGGFGVVILVEDQIVGERMILKFLAPHVAQDEVAIERFKHELRYARRITHENVIRIYDLLSLGGTFAISMEYFSSHSLGQELREGRVHPVRALKMVRAICSGLAVAHREGVVHRDLKPGNILIGTDDQVKIVDFGLAAAVSHVNNRLTRSGLLVGTPAYMAPEQIDGRELNARTDVYSLGVMMYEIFTGALPFESENPMSLLLKHLDGKPVPPQERFAGISDELQTIILKAMAHNPAKRYQAIDDLEQDLGRLGPVNA